MGDLDPERLHPLQHRRGRCRGRGHHPDLLREGPAHGLGRIDQHAHDDRGAAQMGHALLGQGREDRVAGDPAQADLGPGLQHDRPGEAPAVAVEHGQRPQIDRELRHAPDQHVADRVQVRATMVVDDALGIAGGARGVVERDRLPLVGGEQGLKPGSPSASSASYSTLPIRSPPGPSGSSTSITSSSPAGQPHRLAHRRRELGVGEQRLGLAVLQDERQCRRVEPGVQRVEDGAAHRHAVMRLQHRRDVGQHRRHRVAGTDATPLAGPRPIAASAAAAPGRSGAGGHARRPTRSG